MTERPRDMIQAIKSQVSELKGQTILALDTCQRERDAALAELARIRRALEAYDDQLADQLDDDRSLTHVVYVQQTIRRILDPAPPRTPKG